MCDSLTIENICNESPLPTCENCEDSNVKVELDNMDERAVFHPEDLDNNSRADCAIFFSEDHDVGGRFVSLSSEDDSSNIPDYLTIVELKSTYGTSNGVEKQIEGAIEFVTDVLSACAEPPWDLECYCIVPHDTGYKRRAQARVSKHIGGSLHIFRAIPVNNGESLRDIVQRDVYNVEI